jgi:hypothetical protein
MRESRWRSCRLVLWLILCAWASACSDDKKPVDHRPKADFDNPNAISSGSGAKTGGGGNASGQAGAGFLDGSCANGRITAARVSPKIVLVIDGSCSMSTDYPANGAESASECTNNQNGRWTAMRDALIGSNGLVPKLEKVVAFGLVVYGTQPNCPIPGQPVRPALNNGAQIVSGLPMVQPGMYTPTGPALDWVYDNLIDAQGPDDRGAAQVVILATDGEPNSCGGAGGGGRRNGMQGMQGMAATTTNYQPSIDAVNKGTMKGATTYVISLADSTGPFHDHLQQLANLGNPASNGAAVLYEPANPDQLAQNLETLAGAAVGCDIELNGAIFLDQACDGTVSLNGTPLKCNDPNGWKAIDERNIRLQGSACDTVTQKNDSLVEASFTCTAFRPD